MKTMVDRRIMTKRDSPPSFQTVNAVAEASGHQRNLPILDVTSFFTLSAQCPTIEYFQSHEHYQVLVLQNHGITENGLCCSIGS